MPDFVAALLGGLVNIAATVAGRVLVSLGFGVVSFGGSSATLDWLKDQAVTAMAGLGGDILAMLAMLKVGEAISILISAYAVRMLMKGLSVGGMISKMVIDR